MLATYGSAVLIVCSAAVVGQALFALCGRRRWSWLSPAVGLAILTALAWATVRLPGQGTAAILALGLVTVAALVVVAGRLEDAGAALRVGIPLAVAAAVAASLPFFVEGRFGILGTGLNPDMSQHLFAADRLASGGTERLIASGYPLGPHSLVVALSALGFGLVQGFDGLTLATAVIATLTPLAILGGLPSWRRAAGALLVGFAYMVASYLVQGAFKETIEALYILAFAVGLHELAAGELAAARPRQRGAFTALPLAALAVGAVYAYSFPGVLWLGGGAAIWAIVELALAAREGRSAAAPALWRAALVPAAVALLAFALACAPEAGRMADFAGFETFDPTGAGLGNLFDRISPFEALGIWPSGDFRLEPGDGAVPAIAFYLGVALGLLALAFGLWWWLSAREPAVPSVLAAAIILIVYSRAAGTPYQEAKAIALAAAPAMLISARALLETAVPRGRVERILRRRGVAAIFPRSARLARVRLAVVALAAAFTLAAAGSSLLALANGPVGPESYSPALTELRPLRGSTLVLAPQPVLDAHGRDFLVWELRGGRVCVEPAAVASGPPPRGIAHVVTIANDRPPYARVRRETARGDYTVWQVTPPPRGHGPCPLISPGARAEVASHP